MSDKDVSDREMGFGLVRRAWNKFVLALLRPFRRPAVRVWRLGSLGHRVFPTQADVDLLVGVLLKLKPDQDCDLVWGPLIDVIQLDGGRGVNIVTGPGIRVTREGDVVKVDVADGHPAGE